MDSRALKILEFLDQKGEGVRTKISAGLLNLYPDVDNKILHHINKAVENFETLLFSMHESKWISYDNATRPPLPYATGNAKEGYRVLDEYLIETYITGHGKEALEKERNKTTELRLTQSMIQANESINQTNIAAQENYLATQQSYKSQKKSSRNSLILAAISVVFIAVTTILQITDNTSKKLNDLQKEMHEQSETLKKILPPLKGVDSSLKTLSKDTAAKKPN